LTTQQELEAHSAARLSKNLTGDGGHAGLGQDTFYAGPANKLDLIGITKRLREQTM
jgi:hypothetical protein